MFLWGGLRIYWAGGEYPTLPWMGVGGGGWGWFVYSNIQVWGAGGWGKRKEEGVRYPAVGYTGYGQQVGGTHLTGMHLW